MSRWKRCGRCSCGLITSKVSIKDKVLDRHFRAERVMRLTESLAKLRHNGSLVSLRNWSLGVNLRSHYHLRAPAWPLNRHSIIFRSVNLVTDTSRLNDKRLNRRKTDIIDVLLRSSSSQSTESLRRNIPRRRFKIDISVAIRHRTDDRIHTTPEIHHIKCKL